MSDIISRRRLLVGTALLFPALTFAVAARAQTAGDVVPPEEAAPADTKAVDNAEKQLADLEKKIGGRLGVSVLDTETNISLGYRETERFPLCSTYKLLAAGFVLSRVDRGAEKLDRRVTFGKDVLVTYSPVTEKHADTDGMTIAELCEAAITMSDNTAGNLLLDSFGGPPVLTAWLRTLNDTETRLDRKETEVNEAKKGDPRDTTTPDSMLDTVGGLTLGDTLSDASREALAGWMVANTTGGQRLRAGLPTEWKVGDKTGTGDNGSYADVAIIWPADRGPILIAAYVTEATAPIADVNTVFAEVGKIVAGMV
ncbi:class A beta-lactamase [Rhizobium tubonense]|uniref:Beta-lactamase n=1 Tax=Rhizobium tubonense TaxID=484088 RepID=A0A2W4DMA5_9HYPH|nr:class A beta-lactamase [Rhizobium tubonense]PZM17144.1 class A beta-lactamase [Rhizobium tubonense]